MGVLLGISSHQEKIQHRLEAVFGIRAIVCDIVCTSVTVGTEEAFWDTSSLRHGGRAVQGRVRDGAWRTVSN